MASANLLADIVSITEAYLGPASERFIDRIIRSNLGKSPEQINLKDIPKLAEWVKVSLAMLTKDRALVDDCEKSLLGLMTK